MKKTLVTVAAALGAASAFASIRAVSHDNYGGKADAGQMKRHAEKMGVVTNGGAKVVFIGDSITHFWERAGKAQLGKYYSAGDMKMLDLGISADRTEHVLWRLNEGGELDGYEAMAESKVVKGVAYAERQECRLDVRVPVGETNFPTVVWFHGGGLTGGGRHFVPLTDEKIAQVAVGYRLLGKGAARGEDCIADAAAAVAWTIRHIGEYGGDSNKVFVSGMSAGGYLTMMVGMDSKWLAAHGVRNTDLAGLVPISGQATKHFNVRKFSGDDDPQFLPKIDDLAPLAHVAADLPPILSVCGQPPYEWKCRAEENRLLIASCVALGHKNAKFVELDYCDHGRAFAAGLPYLEFFIKGRLSGF